MRTVIEIPREQGTMTPVVPGPQAIAAAAGTLRALSPVNTILCLTLLLDGEMCVGQLQEATGLSQSHVSQILRVLRRQGLVRVRSDRNTRCYSLSDGDGATVFRRLARRLGWESGAGGRDT